MAINRSLLGVLFAIVPTIFPAAALAEGQIVRSDSIASLCGSQPSATIRETFVYVDLAAVNADSLEWGLTLLNKLELAPRESISIFAIDPYAGTVSEEFSSCYPSMTDAEIAAATENRSVLDTLLSYSPEEQQAENLSTYESQVRGVLGAILQKQVSPQGDLRRRTVLEAIALDKTRFGSSTAINRIVIFTDQLDFSQFGLSGPSSVQDAIDQFTTKFPLQGIGGEIYVFGLAATTLDTMSYLGPFMSTLLQEADATLVSASTALPPQESSPPASAILLQGTFETGQSTGSASLSIYTDTEGKATRAWLVLEAIDQRYWLPVDVRGTCTSKSCELEGTLAATVPPLSEKPFFRSGDVITIGGDMPSLGGTLMAVGNEVFEGSDRPVEYQLSLTEIQ